METNETQSPAPEPISESGDLQNVLSSARAEWKQWLGTVAVVLIVVIGVFLYRARMQSNEEQASRMLGEARSGQALHAITLQYPKTSAAQLAQISIAKIQYDAGDYVASLSTYNDFLTRNPGHLMAPAAELGKIQCQEAMGQTADALVAFKAFAEKNPDHYLEPLAIFGEARCLQRLSRLDEARAVYEDFLVAHPNSPWQGEVEESLRDLAREKRKMPAVAASGTTAP